MLMLVTWGAVEHEMEYTPHEIMVITVHKSLKEVERYTKAAEQKRLAKSAMGKLLTQK